ncbi:MAG: NYN domain-containing protein [Bacillota bacterium]|nr:NYN domain-containing protein [Bacillota bacterium]
MISKKIKKYLIIDAYNVINAIDELKIDINSDFEKAREDFIHKMIELGHYTKENVIIVFDAYLVKNRKEKKENRDGVEIVFTKYTQTADSYIEKLVSELSQSILNEVRVVTKDFDEQQIVMGKGAIRVLPRELYYEYNHMSRKIQKKYNKQEGTTKDSLENRLSLKSREALKKIFDNDDY